MAVYFSLTANTVQKREAGTMPRFAPWNMPAADKAQNDEETMIDLYRRVPSDVDPFAAECVYLADDEIREALQWDKLNVADEMKQKLFYLCNEFRDIFSSAASTGKLDTAQHLIDTGRVAPTKSHTYRLSPEKCAVVRDAVTEILHHLGYTQV